MISASILGGLATMACWGMADSFQSILTRRLGTMKTLFMDNLISIALVLPYILYELARGTIAITLNQLLLVIIGSVILTAANYQFLKSLHIGDISVVSPISASYSLLTVILAVLFLGEKLSTPKLAAVLLIVAGAILTSGDLRHLKKAHSVRGLREVLSAALGWGIYFFIIGILSQEMSLSNLFIFTWSFPAIFMIAYAAPRRGVPGRAELGKKGTAVLLLVTNVLFILAWAVFNYAAVHEQISIVAPISSLYPAVVVAFGVIVYKEKLVPNQWAGIMILLCGLALISI